MGFAAENPISTQDIAAYLQLHPTDDVELFTYIMGEMDAEYMSIKYSDKPKTTGTS